MILNTRRLVCLGLNAVLVLAAASLLLLPAHTEANSPAPQCTLGDKSEIWYYSSPTKVTLVGKFAYLCAGGTRMAGTATSYQTTLTCVCSPLSGPFL
jgi:hypothetical protein